MSFSDEQTRLLAGKLSARHVKTRTARDGVELSYIEGWHVIAEANRVFGFEGWDRETISAQCIWHDPVGRGNTLVRQYACAYAARVRITVRVGETRVIRDGSGVGHGTAPMPGEAHESALKEAETDATKRALVTFGNLFGLALYDKERRGVRGVPSGANITALRPAPASSGPWTVRGPSTDPVAEPYKDPHGYCAAVREGIETAKTAAELSAFWAGHAEHLRQLSAVMPTLRNRYGVHFVQLLEDLLQKHRARLEQSTTRVADIERSPVAEAVESAAPDVVESDAAVLAFPKPVRHRNRLHLRFVASQPCLVCRRGGAQAHHLAFAQPRALALKTSDEWAVPLCRTHHRAAHDAGNEEMWWKEQGIDPKTDAQRLWGLTTGRQQEIGPS
jgi:DNA recombination protein Rad52